MEYLKKLYLIIKKSNLIYFLLYKYIADYYRKTVNNTANDIKLKMQMAAFTLKLTENIDKINDLLKVNEDIKKDISSNLTKIDSNESNISSNLTKIGSNESNISSNLSKIDSNESNISSNLSKIDSNESNISSNLSKINKMKVIYLKFLNY